MRRDPLRILLAMRRREVEQARHALAVCLHAEAAAADGITLIDDAVRRDREASRPLDDAHGFQDIFARRLASLQASRRTAVADHVAAQDRSADARSNTVAARITAETVETLIAERLLAANRKSDRLEQHTLDDINRAQLNRRSRPADGETAGKLLISQKVA